MPASAAAIARSRSDCRRMVLQRAAISAGVAAIPLPGIDVVTDIGLLAGLIDDINRAFGLTPAQIDAMQPRMRLLTYRVIVGMGSVLIGKLITHQLLLSILQKTGIKMLARQTTRFVPLAGQLAAAGLSFAAFRAIGFQHIESCIKVVEQVSAAPDA